MTLRDMLTSPFDAFVATEPVPDRAWLAARMAPPATPIPTVGDLTMGQAEAFVLAIPSPSTDEGRAFISSVRLVLQAAWASGMYDPPVGVYVWPEPTPEPPKKEKPTIRWGKGTKP